MLALQVEAVPQIGCRFGRVPCDLRLSIRWRMARITDRRVERHHQTCASPVKLWRSHIVDRCRVPPSRQSRARRRCGLLAAMLASEGAYYRAHTRGGADRSVGTHSSSCAAPVSGGGCCGSPSGCRSRSASPVRYGSWTFAKVRPSNRHRTPCEPGRHSNPGRRPWGRRDRRLGSSTS